MRRRTFRTLLVAMALFGLLVGPGTAEARFFYSHPFPDVDWLTLETEHFLIYYYPQAEWTAKMMAKYAELAYPKVTGLFDYPLKEKIHIVIRDQEDYSNGWAAYSFDQITAWATPLSYLLRGRQEWIPDMFTHEFAHIVSLKANSWSSEAALVVIGRGLVEDGVHNVDFGAQVIFGETAPYVWTEGIAEYGTHLSGYNWWTTSRDMHQRMSFLDDTYLEYDQVFNADSLSGSFDRERGYQQGYSLGLYVMEKYGREQYAQLALNSGNKGHLMWEKNIEDVLGLDGRKLFDGYIRWMKDRYERQIAPIRAALHEGRRFTIMGREEEWDTAERLPSGITKVEVGRRRYEDPIPSDADEAEELAEARKREKPRYEYWTRSQRKERLEKPDLFIMGPKVSPDNKWTAYSTRRTVVVSPMALEEWPFFAGRYLGKQKREQLEDDTKLIKGASADYGFTFSPDSKKVLFSSLPCPNAWYPCIRLDGYYRLDLHEYNLETEDIEQLTRNLRAYQPAFSPDGKTIAFVHIEDGQNHLGLFPASAREVTPDGKCVIDGEPRENCITWLIKKHDGTLLGTPSFSPDGKQIVIDLYRNHQQDVWTLNVDGSDLRPLTWDRAEDRDGQFTPDGKSILYSSDRTGIFNVYQLELASGEVRQLTNVLGGAFTPHLTQAGDLLYGYFTSYGVRIYGLKRDDFYNQVVDVDYKVTPEEIARNLAYEEPLPEIREQSTGYNPFNPKNWAPPIGIPLFIYEDRGVQMGVQALLIDVLDKHLLFGSVLFGQQSVYAISYENTFWYPTFRLGWARLEMGYEFAQGFSSSSLVGSRSEPHFNQPINYKNRQIADFGWLGIDYPLANEFTFSGNYNYRYLSSKRSSGTKDQAFLTNNSYTAEFEYDNVAPYGAEIDINPRGGRRLNLGYTFTRTGLPTKEWADVEWLGRTNPPGDHSDDYNFHELQLGYTEYIPITWWNEGGQNTLELHLRGGWINRNVHRWDEFFGGSQHPLRYVPNFSSTQEFAGYPAYSLRGETMLVFGMAYRFPLRRNIDTKLGPFYFKSLWAEVFGTAGNFWGWTADFERDKYGNIKRHPETYWDPAVVRGSVRLEKPFMDVSSKNGNYMLFDVGFTVKLKAYLFGTNGWNSYFRVAYPLNDIIGQFEVNGDNAFVDAYPNNALYAESKPRALRFSIGIGSDFN